MPKYSLTVINNITLKLVPTNEGTSELAKNNYLKRQKNNILEIDVVTFKSTLEQKIKMNFGKFSDFIKQLI